MENAYKLLFENCFEVVLNANDFFAYSTADSVTVNIDDLEWFMYIVERHGQHGIDAAMAYIRHRLPVDPYLTEAFNLAHQELIKLNPAINSK